uniref:Uncharacterized protein n=1 Tax=Tanacetum cinerariifolium TaxID=118510 RepID=A0A6L2MIU9_TANCI|nr:hypothetical protein [Tanacetum cinerariifolium]
MAGDDPKIDEPKEDKKSNVDVSETYNNAKSKNAKYIGEGFYNCTKRIEFYGINEFESSGGIGYDTKSLLEQCRETIVDNNYDPYDDDMYDGHDISENLQAICDDWDIKVHGRKKK